MSELESLFKRVYDLAISAKRILLISDGKPDGDSIGSTTGMYNWLKSIGKETNIFSIESIPSSLRFLDGVDQISSDPIIFKQPYDLVLTFDASDPVRSGITAYLPTTPKGFTLAVFDHHTTNPRYGDLNVIDISACSTCEIVYRFFKVNKITINPRSATSLLTGIFTDTSSFSNSGTTQIGIEASSELLKSGARFNEILRHLFRNRSIEALKLWGKALERLYHNKTWNIVTTFFTLEDIKHIPNGAELVEGLSNFLNAICGEADTMLVLRELPDQKIKGSLRSVSRDISKLAQQFGGGGHKKAAGFVTKGIMDIQGTTVRILQPEQGISTL